MDRVFESVKFVLSEYKRLALILLLLVFLFPFVTTGILWMERTGYFKNVYQHEHAQLRQLIIDTNAATQVSIKQLKINHMLISSGSYYQQRTCVNTAKTTEAAQLCLTPVVIDEGRLLNELRGAD